MAPYEISPQPVETCVGKTGVLAELSQDGTLWEGSTQPSIWEGCSTTGFGGLVKPPINRLLSASEVSPGAGPTPTNRLAAEMFHKKGFIAKLQERRFISRRHGVPSSSGRPGSTCILPPSFSPSPESWLPPWDPGCQGRGPHRNQWH